MPVRPTLTLPLENFAAAPSTFERVLGRARAADQAGVDRVLVVDHVVMGENIDAYDGAAFPTGPDGPWLEPLTVLGVVAGMTRQVRLGTGILIAALRRPAVLAKAVATLDVLSGGRVDLGVGVGWQREEYEAAGLPFEERGRLLDETIEVCRRLWTDRPASYDGPDLRFERIWCEPKPLQDGGIPIWISGRMHRRTVDRVVRAGAGWIPWGEDRDDPRPGTARLREALADAGRDPDALQVRGILPVRGEPDGLDRAMERAVELVAGGVTDFSLAARLPDDEHAAHEQLAAIVTAFDAATGRGQSGGS